MHANSGADYGGEFLRMCKEGLAELERLDMPKAAALQNQFRQLERLLSGGGKPIVFSSSMSEWRTSQTRLAEGLPMTRYNGSLRRKVK